jgi:hypothetical protein
MRHLIVAVLLILCAPVIASAQAGWRPPSAEMPMMPTATEIRGDWLAQRGQWFNGLDAAAGVSASGLRASGDPRSGSEHVQIARFTSGPLPVVIWSDRNADDRADIIEIFRSGGVIIQVVDADYDGTVNVVRTYDANGALLRQERM